MLLEQSVDQHVRRHHAFGPFAVLLVVEWDLIASKDVVLKVHRNQLRLDLAVQHVWHHLAVLIVRIQVYRFVRKPLENLGLSLSGLLGVEIRSLRHELCLLISLCLGLKLLIRQLFALLLAELSLLGWFDDRLLDRGNINDVVPVSVVIPPFGLVFRT